MSLVVLHDTAIQSGQLLIHKTIGESTTEYAFQKPMKNDI